MTLTEWLLATQLQAPSKLVPVDVAFVLLALLVLLPAVGRRSRTVDQVAAADGPRGDRPRGDRAWRSRSAWRRVGVRAVVAAASAGAALLACWVTSDVVDLFGVALSTVTRMWIAVAAAALGLAVTGIVHGGRRRRAVAIVLVPAALLVPALGVNVEFAKYPTLGTVVQQDPYPWFDEHAAPAARMPDAGVLRKVVIPGRASHFEARPAILWLPPAALVRDPRPLPVVLAFAGQPGAPGDMFTAGRMASVLDAYAAAHHGRAPIVLAVDQLSSPGRNTMCVDSRLGNVDTYVTHDVPAWVRGHLPAALDRAHWGMVGFSQGATCATQFLTEHPDGFAAALAISSELQPVDQSPQHSADQAFGGSVARWEAAAPRAVMAAHGPYRDHAVWFTAGSRDRAFSENARELAAAARRAHIRTSVAFAPGSGHDWNTVQWSLRTQLPRLCDTLGG